MGLRHRIAALICGVLLPVSAGAQGWIGAPVDCRIGQDCWVVQHFDHDPGPGHLDFRCGARAYDTHTGVDIAIGTAANIARNVPVVAAAPGIVVATRDGEEDGVVFRGGVGALGKGVDCGNAVVLDHGNGWRTNYCHMRRGSVAVRQGERVSAGQALGAVGMSGKAEFPHLHFAVRYQGRPLDPYAPHGADRNACVGAQSLWTAAAGQAMAYGTLDITAIGLAPGKPDSKQASAGAYDGAALPGNAGAIVGWAFVWDVKRGDVATFQIADPSGRTVVSNSVTAGKDWRRWFPSVGRRLKGRLAPGRYQVSATVQRPGRPALAQNRTATVTIR